VEMTQILDFHLCYTCRAYGDVAKNVAKKCCNIDENPKSGSFPRKPPEALAHAIYIERRNPFSFCYFTYLSMGCE
jgi:hypothetical protein